MKHFCFGGRFGYPKRRVLMDQRPVKMEQRPLDLRGAVYIYTVLQQPTDFDCQLESAYVYVK